MKRRTAQPTVEITIEQAFALAARVHRELGGYFKNGNSLGTEPNKAWIMRYMVTGATANKQDQARGLELLAHCRGHLLKKLTNSISEYDSAILAVASRATITDADRYDVALLASVPQTVARAETRERQDLSLLDRQTSYLAPVGSRVTGSITVVRSTFSNNYGVFFTTAKTEDNHVVFFAYKTQLKAGETYSIRGTVKAHRDEYQTQLSRVKVQS